MRGGLSVITETGVRQVGGKSWGELIVLQITSLAILVACLTCSMAGVTSKPERFLPLMDSSKSLL